MWRFLAVATLVVAGCGGDSVNHLPPETVLDSKPASLTNQTHAIFEFHAEGDATGFQCTVDGSPSECTSPFAVDLLEGAHHFTVAAEASTTVGNTPAAYDWTIDTTPPETTITTMPAVIDNSVTESFAFAGTDPGDRPLTFECAVDAGAFAACTSPDAITPGDGDHVFHVRAVDAAGNTDPTPATYSWTLDTTTPDTTITDGPAEASTSGPSVTFGFTSPEPGATFECAVDGAAFAACTSPLASTFTDGAHAFAVRAKNVHGILDPSPAMRGWTVDATSPAVSIDSHPTDPTNDNTPSFGFSSGDATATFECALDAGAFAACTSVFDGPVVADGSHVFHVRATDPVGNQSSASFTWVTDTVAPTVAITSGPTGGIAVAAATYTFTTAGSPVTTECALDGVFAACTSPSAFTGLADGDHTFVARVTDAAGNVGTDSRAFTVDTTPPSVAITSGPPNPTNINTPTFTFVVTGATVVDCRVDAGAFAVCASPLTTAALSDGSHTVTVRGSDAVGNQATASQTFTVDTAAPTVAITSGPTGATNVAAPTFTFTTGGSPTTTSCRFDAAAFTACTSPLTAATLADGAHTLEVKVTDAAGNSGSATRTFTVDTIAPTVTLTSTPANPTNLTTASFAFTTSEGTTQCKLDGGAFTACTAGTTFNGLGAGAHTFVVQATDAAGNTGSATFTWTIDTSAPTVTITSGPANPTNLTTATFVFTTSEGTLQCKLDTGAFAACSSPASFTGIAQGAHTFTVQATDTAGNTGSASFPWTVDTAAPTVTFTSTPTNPSKSAAATFAFTVSDGTIQCKLDGGAFAACASPKALAGLAEGSHTFTVQATDTAGNTGNASFTWIVDTVAPSVTITSGPANPTNLTTATFVFTTSEGTLQCKLDTGAFAACSSPASFTGIAQGAHTFTVQATDTAGNTGSASFPWTVDTGAPTVTFTSTPANPSASASATFAFTVSDGTIQCNLDGGAFAACASPKALSGLADGSHTFTVQAKDTAGNTGSASFTWTIDTSAPTVTFTSTPPNPSTSASASFGFTVSDGTIQCKLDGGAFAACASPKALTGLADGSHTFTVQAKDAAGNTGSASFTWTVDTSAPTVTFTSTPANPSSSAAATFGFTVSDGTIQCKLDGGAFAACASPKAFTGLADGSHTFTVQATDTAGNVGSASFTWTVDTTPPTVTITGGPSGPTNDNTPTFSFTTTGATGTKCQVDAGVPASCTSPFTTATLADGAHTFTVVASDAAGNTASAARSFSVDATPPVVSIDAAPPAKWPVNYFDMKFHSPESGVTLTCSLNGGTFAACTSPRSITTTYGTASTFTVHATDALGNVGTASATWTSTAGLVLHYPYEQGSTANTSLLAQVPALSPDGDLTGLTTVGGWAGSAIIGPQKHTYKGTIRALSSSVNGSYTASVWVRIVGPSNGGDLWSNGSIALTLNGSLAVLSVTEANGTVLQTSSQLPGNQWVNVAVRTTGPGKGVELWVNGTQTGTAASVTTGFDAGQASDVTFGQGFFDVDDLRFYNVAFTPTEMCTTVVRGIMGSPNVGCIANRPGYELAFEEGSIQNTGFWSMDTSTPLQFGFDGFKLGGALDVTVSGLAFQMSGFRANASNTVFTPQHSFTSWLRTTASSQADTVVDFTGQCIPGVPGNCGASILFVPTPTPHLQFFFGTANTSKSASVNLGAGTHSIVVTEQKASDGTTTQSMSIYIDGKAPLVVAIGTGNVFSAPSNTVLLPHTANTVVDEYQFFPRDLSADPEMLCENGFDGEFDPATGSCSLTSN